MQSWNNIINTALLGTDKKMPAAEELPQNLGDAFALIQANSNTDREEKFLQTASLLFSYKQCGVLPIKKEQVGLALALPEIKPYCSKLSLQVLKDIISEDSIPLLQLWLKYCAAANQLAPPEMLPAVLSAGAENKKLQPFIPACTGNRGEWLVRLNDSWNFSGQHTTEDLWQTGTPEQRKNLLKETRANQPSQAREWLQQAWPQEDAATKVSFLEILEDTIADEDISFLESLVNEKGKKVKEAAAALLKRIPNSPVVQQYQQVLSRSVTLKKEKVLLGLSSKMVLHFELPAVIDEAVFKSGIEKLSSTKDFSDEEFIIYQLMQSVPPVFWQQQLDATAEQVIQLFQKDTTGKKMLPALVVAIQKFRDKKWAFAMMQYADIFYLDIIPLVPALQQEEYSNRFFSQHPDSIVQYAVLRDEEWSSQLARNILQHMAQNIYQYPRSFYNQHIRLIPASIAVELKDIIPKEEYMQGTWANTSEYILKLLQLKQQLIQSFNPQYK